MLRVVIIAPAHLPIPATKGGAIEKLTEHLLKQNELSHKIDFTVISPYDKEAFVQSQKYENTHFVWYKTNGITEKIKNRLNRHIICPLKGIPFISNWQNFVVKQLRKTDCEKVLIANNIEFLPILKRFIGDKELICHLHNRFELSGNSLDSCDKVLTVSEYIKQEAIKQTHYPSENIYVIKNCVDKNDFSHSEDIRQQTRVKFGLGKDEIAICFLGRIVNMKGVRHLVEAFKKLNAPNTRLFIIGSLGGNFAESNTGVSPFVQELMHFVEPIKRQVIFTGYMPNNQIHEILSAMDIAANPSLYYEAAPVSNVEYEAMGLPLITTNRGGIPEYVTDDCGFILDADADLTEQIYNSLKLLISDKSLRKRMGEAGLRNAQEYYCEQYLKKFIEII